MSRTDVKILRKHLLFSLVICLQSFVAGSQEASAKPSPPPHILFLLVDDLGWGNIGYHVKSSALRRQQEVQTPVMDRLAKVEGLELNRHYVHHSCSGTRVSLQSGRFPVHVQTTLKNPEDPSSGMPRNLTGFAEYLQQNKTYATHYVGKWDNGMVCCC